MSSVAPPPVYRIIEKLGGARVTERICYLCGTGITVIPGGSEYAYNLHLGRKACVKQANRIALAHENEAANIALQTLSRGQPVPRPESAVPSIFPDPDPNTITSSDPTTSTNLNGHSRSASYNNPSDPLRLDTSGSAPRIYSECLSPSPTPSSTLPPHPTFHFSSESSQAHPPLLPSQASPSTPILSLLTPITQCPGAIVDWISSGPAWETYPFHTHGFANHSWEPIRAIGEDKIVLRSNDCSGLAQVYGNVPEACASCASIASEPSFEAIRMRAESAPAHIPYKYLSFAQVVKLLRQAKALEKKLKLQVHVNHWLQSLLLILNIHRS